MAPTGVGEVARLDGCSEVAFAGVMDPMRKVVPSTSLDTVDWNAESVSGDVVDAVRTLQEQPGRGIALGGVRPPAMLAAHGLIDEFTFVVHPVVAGWGRGSSRGRPEAGAGEAAGVPVGVIVRRYRAA